MQSELSCGASRASRETIEVLLVASNDNAAPFSGALSRTDCRVDVVRNLPALTAFLAGDASWNLVLVIGHMPGAECEELAIRVANSKRAKMVCTVAQEQIHERRVVRMIESLLHAYAQPSPELTPGTPPHAEIAAAWLLDECDRTLAGVDMEPMISGELRLLQFLGGQPQRWYLTRELSQQVYGRADTAGRQLVWKYASTLRKKLAAVPVPLMEVCRRRGYRCVALVRSLNARDASAEPPCP